MPSQFTPGESFNNSTAALCLVIHALPSTSDGEPMPTHWQVSQLQNPTLASASSDSGYQPVSFLRKGKQTAADFVYRRFIRERSWDEPQREGIAAGVGEKLGFGTGTVTTVGSGKSQGTLKTRWPCRVDQAEVRGLLLCSPALTSHWIQEFTTWKKLGRSQWWSLKIP